jgi:hypothetical protein
MKIVGFFCVSFATLLVIVATFHVIVATLSVIVATIQLPPNFIWLFPKSLLSFIIERKYETGGSA